VAVLVNRGLTKLTRVLFAYAGGPEDLAALELARRLARAPGTSLTLLHVVDPNEPNRRGPGREQIASALKSENATRWDSTTGSGALVHDQVFPEAGTDSGAIRLRLVEHASPPDAVLEESRLGYDLIVLGMHTQWGLGAGTISLRRRRVLSEAPVSILAVHPPLLQTSPASTSDAFSAPIAHPAPN
jgi:nucleotide-binding universal stress UspA family protein